jgi:hypothetical protein
MVNAFPPNPTNHHPNSNTLTLNAHTLLPTQDLPLHQIALAP